MVTSDPSALRKFSECRKLDTTHVRRKSTARIEPTTRWWISYAGDLTADRRCLAASSIGRIGARHRIEQGLCIGMARRTEKRVTLSHLHHLAKIHHTYPVADMPYNGQVVCNEQISEPESVLEVHQEIDNLRLDRHIKSRNRLIANKQRRIKRQGAGYSDPLALTAGELVWITISHIRPQSDKAHQLINAAAIRTFVARKAMYSQRFADQLRHTSTRVQGSERILINHLNTAPERTHLPLCEPCEIFSVEPDRSCRERCHTKHRLRSSRFSAARLADN